MPGHEGKAIHGVFTRDYRYNLDDSRILVTVPACLEILLLGAVTQPRVKTIRYVIFDEVRSRTWLGNPFYNDSC